MLYYIHNTSRDPRLRAQRYSAAHHKGLVQFIGHQRVVRGRPAAISEETLKLNLEVLRAKVEAGQIEVRTVDGRRVNLNTLEASPTPATPPLPITPVDSLANDPPTGIPMPIYPDGIVQSSRPTPAQPKEVVAETPTVVAETVLAVNEEAEVEFHEGDSVSSKNKYGRGKRR